MNRLISGAQQWHRVTIEKRSSVRRYVCSVTGAELDTDSARGQPSAHARHAITEWIFTGGDTWRPVRLEAYDFAASRLLGAFDEQGQHLDRASLGVLLDLVLADVQV